MSALVSIVLAVRDDAQRLPRSVQSIKDQTFEDWELIVVDDGSQDESLATAETLAAGDPRIRVVASDPIGIAPARNLGMANAAGTWIAVIDSDDLWHPRKLERQLAFAAENPNFGVIATAGYRLSATGRRLGTYDVGPASLEEFRRLRASATPFGLIHASVLIRRDLVEKLGGYPCDYPLGEDLAYFNLRLAPYTDIVMMSERLVSAEIRPDSISRRRVGVAFDVHEAVALNLRRQRDGLPELSYEMALEALAGRSVWGRLARRRLRERHRHYTMGASALAAGSPRGFRQLAVALLIAPFYTTRRFTSQVGLLAVERLRNRRAAA
jgi:glycosyltransferase involved in cell wall biosynthesis